MFTSSVRIRNSVCTCLDWYKAGSKLVSFSRVSSLFRVSRVQLGALLWKLCWLTLRDVTGKALPSSEVVEFVILWCYGFGTVLDFCGWFRCESPAGRLPGQPCARLSVQLRVQEYQRVAREKRELRRGRASSFQLSGLDAAHRRLIESDCPYGAEPRPCPWFSGAMPTRHLIFNSM